jgi:6-phosphogluconolactonase (cycloisomerase 2 family)
MSKGLLWLVNFFALLVTASAFAQHQFVYTNDNASPATTGTPNTVSAFRVNSDGTLTLLSGSPFATGGNGNNGADSLGAFDIAIVQRMDSPSLLYAVNQGDGTISAFTINPGTGNLSLIGGSPFLIDGLSGVFSITASPDGKLLFLTNDSTTLIRAYSISTGGTLSQIPGSPFETGNSWRGLKVTANGRFLLAGEATGNTGIGVFSIGRSGALSAAAGSPFPGSGPSNGVAVNCAGRLAFHIDNQQNVDVYSMNPNGTLSAVAGSPFQTTTGYNAGLALSPSNQFVFVTDPFGNNGASDISSFVVANGGALTPAPGSPYPALFGPGGVAATTTSQDGKYLYSYGFVYAQVDVQRIAANGSLTEAGDFITTGQGAAGSGMGIATFPPPTCDSRQ